MQDVDYKSLLEAAPGLYLILLPDLTIAAASDAYLKATMTTRDEIVGRPLFEVFPDNPNDPVADGASNLRISLEYIIQHKTAHSMALQKYDIRRPDGSFEERFWSPLNKPVLNENKQVRYIIHRVEDMTDLVALEREKAQQLQVTQKLKIQVDEMTVENFRRAQEVQEINSRLMDANQFLNSVLENIPNMIFVKDAKELRFVRFNKAGETLLGHKREDLIGKSDSDFFPKEQADFFMNKDKEVIRQGALMNIEQEKISTLAGERILHTKKIPIYDSSNSPAYLLGISEDITERKKAEDKINLLNKELEAFTYSISHDLRAPLRSVSGYAQMLIEDHSEKLGDEGKRVVGVIISNARRMDQLINDLLDFSRMARKEMTHESVDMNSVVDSVVRELTAAENGRRLKIDARSLKPSVADASMIRQVWINLVSNALKYSRKQEVTEIEIGSFENGHEHPDEVGYYIRDNGAGFDMAYVNKLFGVFQRLHKSTEFEGTGVGLALTKRIVERHGGRIWAEGKKNEGAQFYFTISQQVN